MTDAPEAVMARVLSEVTSKDGALVLTYSAISADQIAALRAAGYVIVRDTLLNSAKEVECVLTFAFEDGALSDETVLQLCIDPHGVLADLRASIAAAQEDQP